MFAGVFGAVIGTVGRERECLWAIAIVFVTVDVAGVVVVVAFVVEAVVVVV